MRKTFLVLYRITFIIYGKWKIGNSNLKEKLYAKLTGKAKFMVKDFE